MLDFFDIKSFKYPTCQKDGFHEGEPVNLICIEECCLKQKNYLLCTQCFDNNHKSHQIRPLKFILAHIIKQNQNKEQNNLEQFVEDSLNKENVLEKYQEIINNMMEKTFKMEQLYKQYFENLHNYIENHFQKQQNISNLLKDVVEQSHDIDNFQESMNKVIERSDYILQEEFQRLNKIRENGEDSTQKKSENIQTLTQYLENSFETEKTALTNQLIQEKLEKSLVPIQMKLDFFNNETEKVCQAQIDQIQNLLKNSSQLMEGIFKKNKSMFFNFIKNSNTQSQSLIEKVPGYEFEVNPNGGNEQTIVSSVSFDSGQHGYTMQIQDFSTTCFLIGIYEEHEALANKTTNGNHPWSCLFNTCKGKIKVKPGTQFTNFSQAIKKGENIKVQLDYENNEYTVSDEHGKCEYQLQKEQYNFAGKKIKFFISFYNSNCKVSLKIIDTY
ncbi:hypothetical protein PPERSA_05971 [Pseudocohnilembus persalinus]|uniref:Uncharacterized protein n=1 Tax=Pseudocohnilembus persalinus TaxID=266149 RepID=A0A0V0R483_PSEPJ|nr:hypothetical protein PPERSA_05971 [Pseudocohnilembus persalinus]|eukprot:KRX09302.1 hypothetical protein PPERSA_05971 [Pseudocohnilembus persalinus]